MLPEAVAGVAVELLEAEAVLQVAEAVPEEVPKS